MRIQHNLIATHAVQALNASTEAAGTSLEKLSSGYRINRAADDATGLVISQKLRAQVSSLKVATRNAQDGINMLRVAEGAYASIGDQLQRMRDLVVQYSNAATRDATSEAALSGEFDQLFQNILGIFRDTKWGGHAILSGGFERTFQVGTEAGDTITASMSTDLSSETVVHGYAVFGAESLPIDGTINYGDYGGSGTVDMLTAITNAIDTVSAGRAFFGALENRLDAAVSSLQNATENLSASESRIRDTDTALESVSFTRHQILQQSSAAMLAQASKLPAQMLKLL